MKNIPVAVKKDFIESISTARPIDALAELIWNGFDAGSTKVQVFVKNNALDVIDQIRVCDNGYGIDHSKVEDLFGSLGDSWKKNQGKQNGRTLHGKNGKGRFKAFALGEKVQWQTHFNKDEAIFSFSITSHLNHLNNFEITEPALSNGLGTEVIIENIPKNFRSLLSDTTSHELAKIFALYLTEYPEVSLEYNGEKIESSLVQSHKEEYPLGDIILSDEKTTTANLVIIEWKIDTERAIYLCDVNGVSLHELPTGKIRAPGFYFTAYVKCDYFRELDKTNLLLLSDMHPDAQAILIPAKEKIKQHFRNRILAEQSKIIERWKMENIYPYEEKTDISSVETVERQVFDILAVSVQSNLPSFDSSDIKSKKFTFKLLAQAIKNNPDSVQVIISEVLGLKKAEQDEFALLLKKTSLASIISTAKVIANRLDFLKGLGNLLFDKETKSIFLERDQLHKILENEAWLFHEEFSLASSEETLEDVLKKHLGLLGDREDTEPVDVGDGKRGRIDLMLQKVIQPRVGEFDYLVVELKRPSQKITGAVLTQIEKYAFAVANDERFLGVKARWTFLVISNELDDFAKRKTNQRDWPKGKVHDDSELNITVWAKSWAEIIGDAKSRLHFINQSLLYQANRDSAKEYLEKTHSKYIPKPNDKVESNELLDVEIEDELSE